MASTFLTKSDFKACLDCQTKLYYRKMGYASSLDDNEYMQFLADGGFMVEYIAKARYPNGVDLSGERDPQRTFARTQELIDSGAGTIFEAAVIAGKYYVRVDILGHEGNVLHLIEVKSSGISEDDDAKSPFLNESGKVNSKWYSYLIDVAFQAHVLGLAFPGYEVRPQLCLIDKNLRVTATETLGHFKIQRDNDNPKSRPKVLFTGNLKDLSSSKIVCFRSVQNEISALMPEVIRKAEALAKLIGPNGRVNRTKEDIENVYKICRVCEYRLHDGRPDGFAECWGQLASAKPHILDLHRVGQIVPDPVPSLLKRGKASLLDLEEFELGKEGTYQKRRLIQWEHSRNGGSERLPAELVNELEAHKITPGWPLHFLDFEACNIALPHHVGLRPYERIAFQWSCHTLTQDGSFTHAEWLNTKKELPNFNFAQALRRQIGDKGTIYVWSPYEQSTLNQVLIQIDDWIQRESEEAVRNSGLDSLSALDDLGRWIDSLLGPEDDRGKRANSPRIRDLHKLALTHYFHPRMAGRTSIKVVLPAVWEYDAEIRNHPWFKEYLRLDSNGNPTDPYKTLPPLPIEDEEDDVVQEGSGAIRVYQDLLFSSDSERDALNRQNLLLQYCKLDTAAMVMIWMHWIRSRR